MLVNQIGATGFALALGGFALLAILLATQWRSIPGSRLLTVAAWASVLWAAAWLAAYSLDSVPVWIAQATDGVRSVAWLYVTVELLRRAARIDVARLLRSPYALVVAILVVAPIVNLLVVPDLSPDQTVWIAFGYVTSLLTVLSAEQLFRNSLPQRRSSTTYLCIAIAGMFVFDVVMFVLVAAGTALDPDLLASRGYVGTMLVAPLALGIWRRSHPIEEGRQPRRIVLYSFGVSALLVYITIAVVGHYYVHNYGGTWSSVGSIVLIAAATAGAVILAGSGTVRARVRVLLMKTFFQYKYDYREEWLRFIGTLSESGLDDVKTTAVRAVAQIVNSPGGVVFVQESGGTDYVPAGAWRSGIPEVPPVRADSGLIGFLNDRQWVIDLEELRRLPGRYADLTLSDWLTRDGHWWLVVPVFLASRLYGFVLLQKPRVAPSLNFEDHDLLKTVGRHVGMHINQAESDKRLAESQQFDTYHRLTAFLMHDLNNLIAQQSLVVKNAERFRDNPKFVDDAIDTIANSVARMRRLMDQLSHSSTTPKSRRIELQRSLAAAVEHCKARSPVPKLSMPEAPIAIQANGDRLSNVFEHLIRNAQDATSDDGTIDIRVRCDAAAAEIAIEDTGSGMSTAFIRERLFQPFDSTKGSGSMGVGAYQARDYVRSLGGQLEVKSRINEGTTFTIRLPLSGSPG